ncbi:MAG: hypothetical protein H7Y11_11355 [Armatimonadetes bacterium]|nr:hypothetical protein [Anaerolineae bacterium]
MDEWIQLSVLVSYFWVTFLAAFFSAVILRRRRIDQLELAYLHQHPPLPYRVYRRAEETQELPAVKISGGEKTQRLRHINPSQQVSMEITPDADGGQALPAGESNLQKLISQLTKTRPLGSSAD